MKKNMQIYVLIGLTFGFILLLLFLYPGLPAQLPMQWGLDGKVNYTFPKLPVVSAMVLIQVTFNVFSVSMHRNEPKIPSKDFFTSIIIVIICATVLTIAYIA